MWGEWRLHIYDAVQGSEGVLNGWYLTFNDTCVAVVEGEGEGEGGEEGEAPAYHSGDQNKDGRIDLSELLRVIQFLNSGSYHCDAGTEDGYAPGPGGTGCLPHSSDYAPQDWQVNLSELLRLIQFFNSGGYFFCPDEETEDGYCPRIG